MRQHAKVQHKLGSAKIKKAAAQPMSWCNRMVRAAIWQSRNRGSTESKMRQRDQCPTSHHGAARSGE